MKNNCLFIFDQPSENHDEVVAKLDDFFKDLRSTHYVYVAETNRDKIEDSPGGARFLRWNESLIESFGNLSTIVIADNEELYFDLRSKVPESVQVVSMNLSGENAEPASEISKYFLAASVSSAVPAAKRAAA